MQLSDRDKCHLAAAEGWLTLGDVSSTFAELDEISKRGQSDPAVLSLRAQLLSRAEDWIRLLPVAEALTRKIPKSADRWTEYTLTLSRLGKTEEALRILSQKRKEFVEDPYVPFHLAYFCCELKRFDDAREWIKQMLLLDHANEYAPMFFDDPQLKKLWEGLESFRIATKGRRTKKDRRSSHKRKR